MYFPLKAPTDRGPARAASQPQRVTRNYPADALPLRTHDQFIDAWRDLDDSDSDSETVTKATGMD